MAIKIIVGLGNPGINYALHRHNIGFWWLDSLAKRAQVTFKTKSSFNCQLATANLYGQETHLAKPNTYVNKSGNCVSKIAHYFKIKPQEMLIVYDELDLPPGVAKLKINGQSAGHKGVKSIVSILKNSNFLRLRIGIGRPKKEIDVAKYVLSKPSQIETECILGSFMRTFDTLPAILSGDTETAMHRLHTASAAVSNLEQNKK